jgi:hypothetical protein
MFQISGKSLSFFLNVLKYPAIFLKASHYSKKASILLKLYFESFAIPEKLSH